jgi:hypothetical protein
MDLREIEEYRALRETIRQRGTSRVWVALAGLVAWAALTLATAALFVLPVATLLPLLVLAATFELVFSLHVGVERIGRYLQVFFETDDGGGSSGWEHAAMAYGRAHAGGTDPLFALCFAGAAVLNLLPAALAAPVPIEWAVVGLAHAAFGVRLARARSYAARQRALDLDRFRRLKETMTVSEQQQRPG